MKALLILEQGLVRIGKRSKVISGVWEGEGIVDIYI